MVHNSLFSCFNRTATWLIKHSVVFSTWLLTLDLVQVGLDKNAIRSIRFDGRVPQSERGDIVNQFRTDPQIRVMLLTLSCGAVG